MPTTEPTLPPPLPPDARGVNSDHSTAMRSFRPQNSSPASSLHSEKLSPHSPRTISRRASMDLRSAAARAASPGPGRERERAPSTPPTIRKRASMVSLSTLSNGGTMTPQPNMRRRASLLSLRGSPPSSSSSPEPTIKRDMTPPTQDPYAVTTVILHDATYKHRYSRPKTSKAELESIVERPERIQAAVYGICAAQVRAGKERLSINKTTRMGKLADPEVMLVHAHTALERGKKSWPDELSAMTIAATEKLKRGQLEVSSSYHQGDLYLCGESLEDLEGCIGAVYDGVDAVFGEGPVKHSFVCIRPPGHHCAERDPSGFCWLNNVHIAIAHAAKDHGLSHAVILDFDLHHGDGSQAITWSINELAANIATSDTAATKKRSYGMHVPTIGYFSLHDVNSYPCESGDKNKILSASVNLEAHNQFIHNVHLKPYSTEDHFWTLYQTHYTSIFTKARQFLKTASTSKSKTNKEFKAGIFLSAGFDASEHETPTMQRHQVNVPTDFFAKFTADAVALAEEYCGGRVVSVLEGGYSDRAITSGVFAHISGLSCVAPDQVGYIPSQDGINLPSVYCERQVIWDRLWWSVDHLQELERLTQKQPKKSRTQKNLLHGRHDCFYRKSHRSPTKSIQQLRGNHKRRPTTPKTLGDLPEVLEIPAISKSSTAGPGAAANKRHSMPPGELTMTLRTRKAKPDPIPATAPAPATRGRRASTAGYLTDASSARTSRAPSRSGSSRAVTPVTTGRSDTPALKGKPPATAATGATVAGPRSSRGPAPNRGAPARKPSPPLPAPIDMDAVTGKLAKVKITYNNKDKDKAQAEEAEYQRQQLLQQMEAEKRELEDRLEREKRELEIRVIREREERENAEREKRQLEEALDREREAREAREARETEREKQDRISREEEDRKKSGVTSSRLSYGGIPRSAGTAVANARKRLESNAAQNLPNFAAMSGLSGLPPLVTGNGVTSSAGKGLQSLPSSPPQVMLNGHDIPGMPGADAGLGHFHGVVKTGHGGKDQTFRGNAGDIRFANS
ncbi:Similar to Histone deacetylase HOS3; acc. no. Q02959 [Pyronema omphalodes CBS 100304]|uniref:Similar to Histone deacetylase HOS3 acc. no. Q02959 n=1 Tax=Pyronema omphalodes (strain CBS 100304) TaxID=1076935 RepID=U4LS10_PYROM|nr:Similar to Histone deacetylase HOS3; acc. no. Q02959 [Pyronema omphalodes CBS 100304]